MSRRLKLQQEAAVRSTTRKITLIDQELRRQKKMGKVRRNLREKM